METTPIRVCITGAAGQIAYAFIPLLLTGQVFGNRKVSLNLLDIPPAENVLKGVIMEIHDGAYPLIEEVTSGTDPTVMFKDVDVIVFLGGFPRKQGMERKDLLHMNKNIFKTQGAALSSAKTDVKCVVVANPANTNAKILAHFNSGKTPQHNITCLSRLDHNRAISQIALKANCNVADIDNVVVFGNHSLTQYPSIITPTVKGESIEKTFAGESEWLKTTFISSVQKRGGEILQTRGNSSVFSAANAVKDHLRDWYHGSNGKIVSMGVVSEGDYNITKGLWTSLPVRCTGGFKYDIVKDAKVSEFCKEKIAVTVKELEQELVECEL